MKILSPTEEVSRLETTAAILQYYFSKVSIHLPKSYWNIGRHH